MEFAIDDNRLYNSWLTSRLGADQLRSDQLLSLVNLQTERALRDRRTRVWRVAVITQQRVKRIGLRWFEHPNAAQIDATRGNRREKRRRNRIRIGERRIRNGQ